MMPFFPVKFNEILIASGRYVWTPLEDETVLREETWSIHQQPDATFRLRREIGLDRAIAWANRAEDGFYDVFRCILRSDVPTQTMDGLYVFQPGHANVNYQLHGQDRVETMIGLPVGCEIAFSGMMATGWELLRNTRRTEPYERFLPALLEPGRGHLMTVDPQAAGYRVLEHFLIDLPWGQVETTRLERATDGGVERYWVDAHGTVVLHESERRVSSDSRRVTLVEYERPEPA